MLEASFLPNIIDYYRRCYREDSYDLSISNIEKLRKDRVLKVEHEDVLACGDLPRFPVVKDHAAKMQEQSEAYRKERLLIYGCLMVRGQLEAASGFSRVRKVNTPLLYFPASFENDEDLFVVIDQQELRVNKNLLRLALKEDVDKEVLDSFPEVSWPLTPLKVSQIGSWLKAHTLIGDTTSLVRWPRFFASEVGREGESARGLSIQSACCLVLADRSKGSRGVLHELNQLAELSRFSSVLDALFGLGNRADADSRREASPLPCLLSEPQTKALNNSANFSLSMISGPPGTGKSFTIAAMALDRMLQGESVLVVSKSTQAVDVVTDKLKTDFGLESGYVHAFEENFLKTIKAYLESLLKEGVDECSELDRLRKELRSSQRGLAQKERDFLSKLWVGRNLDEHVSWFKRIWAKYQAGKSIDEYCAVLWKSQSDIGLEQDKFEGGAREYINSYRKSILAQALKERRPELVKFQQSLRSRTSKTLEERFQQVDFSAVFKAFPIWLVTLDELNRVLPLKRELFDLVIVDEATQCDISSSLPALYRARRAVVVGDGKQLRHVSFLARNQQHKLWEQVGLGERAEDNYSYRDLSLLDIVADSIPSQDAISLLDEHYRSKPELIEFSNHHFYSGRLKVMQARPNLRDEGALQFVKVNGTRAASGRNTEEKHAIVAEIRSLIDSCDCSAPKPSIGVLSPYREQAEYLERSLKKEFTSDQWQAFNLLVATPYGFQGEERDVILLSFALDNQSARAAGYLSRKDMFNVAITRAKQRQVVFYSIDLEFLAAENLFKQYLERSVKLQGSGVRNDVRCEFAQDLSNQLNKLGVQTWVGYEVAGQQIDVLCQLGDAFLGIDLIGGVGEFEEAFSLVAYKVLHRAGIEVIPLPYFMWQNSPESCVDMVKERLQAIQS